LPPSEKKKKAAKKPAPVSLTPTPPEEVPVAIVPQEKSAAFWERKNRFHQRVRAVSVWEDEGGRCLY
jgi:hypothetical protein